MERCVREKWEKSVALLGTRMKANYEYCSNKRSAPSGSSLNDWRLWLRCGLATSGSSKQLSRAGKAISTLLGCRREKLLCRTEKSTNKTLFICLLIWFFAGRIFLNRRLFKRSYHYWIVWTNRTPCFNYHRMNVLAFIERHVLLTTGRHVLTDDLTRGHDLKSFPEHSRTSVCLCVYLCVIFKKMFMLASFVSSSGLLTNLQK